MAIEWADNFQNYGTGNRDSAARGRLSNGIYALVGNNVDLPIDPDPNFSTPVLRIFGIKQYIRKVYSSFGVTKGVGVRLWIDDFPDSLRYRPAIRFSDALGSTKVTVAVNPTGQLAVYATTTNLENINPLPAPAGITPGPVLVTNAWQHVEVKCKAGNGDGEVEVRVEGVPVLVLTGQTILMDNNEVAMVDIVNNQYSWAGTNTSVSSTYVKDLVTWGTSGTENVDFLGSVGVFTLWPDSDVDLNWTPSIGSEGWSILDNNPPVDTQYISADDTPPAAYVATMTNLPEDVTSVKALMTVVRARKTDGGDGNLQVSLVSNGDEAAGEDRPLTTAFTYWFDVSEIDPDTGVAWSPTAVDNVELKIDRTI